MKQIKLILENPALDKEQLLTGQKRMLELKKERLERIIASIEDILKGDNKMDFGIFSKADMEQMYRDIESNMTVEQKEIFVKEYGSMEAFRNHFLDNASSEEGTEKFRLKWWNGMGIKRAQKNAATNPDNAKIVAAYGKRLDQVQKNWQPKAGSDVNTLEVKEIVGEMDFVSKQLYQMEDVTAFMLDMAEKYVNNVEMQKQLDAVYGEGSTLFIGQALQNFYKTEK